MNPTAKPTWIATPNFNPQHTTCQPVISHRNSQTPFRHRTCASFCLCYHCNFFKRQKMEKRDCLARVPIISKLMGDMSHRYQSMCVTWFLRASASRSKKGVTKYTSNKYLCIYQSIMSHARVTSLQSNGQFSTGVVSLHPNYHKINAYSNHVSVNRSPKKGCLFFKLSYRSEEWLINDVW